MARNISFTVKYWKQDGPTAQGHFDTHEMKNIPDDTSFLEMLDILNEELIESGQMCIRDSSYSPILAVDVWQVATAVEEGFGIAFLSCHFLCLLHVSLNTREMCIRDSYYGNAAYIHLKNSKYYLRVTYLRVIFRNFVPNY